MIHAACGDGDEVIIREVVKVGDATVSLDDNTKATSLVKKKVDDGLRVLRLREDAMIGLGDQSHASALEPLIGILMTELLKEALQQAVAPRIDTLQVGDIFKGVGAVAASATRDLHFGQYVVRGLKDGDIHLWTHLLEINGQEESRRSSTDDSCLHSGLLFIGCCFCCSDNLFAR